MSQNAKEIFALLAIVVVGAVLRIVVFSGVVGSDDLWYSAPAYKMACKTFSIVRDSDISSLRIGLVAPVSFLYRFMGVSEWTMVAYPFVMSVVSIVLAYIGGRVCAGGNRAGLIAAVLQAIIPIDIAMASRLNGDIPAAFCLNAGMVLVYAGVKAQNRKKEIVCGFASGIMLGLSWLIRESAVFVMPVVAGYLLWVHWRERKIQLLMVSLVMALGSVVIVEAWVYFRATGDLLFRLHAIAEASRNAWSYDTTIFKNNVPSSLLQRLIVGGPRIIFTTPQFGGLTLLAGVAGAFVVGCRYKGLGFLLFWYVSLILLFNFGTTSFHRYAPLIMYPRYLYPLLFPAILIVGAWLARMFPGMEDKVWMRERLLFCALICGYLLLKCGSQYHSVACADRPSAAERTAFPVLASSGVIYTDSRTLRVLSFMEGYSEKLKLLDFEGLPTAALTVGARAFINPGRIDFMHVLHGYSPPECYTNVPPSWECEWRYQDSRIFLIQ